MSDWQDIETAPKDGTFIQAEIPGHGKDNIIFWMDGLLDAEGEECGAWRFEGEQEPPDCWTDGICWEVNEDLERSVAPTRWKHLPPITDEDIAEAERRGAELAAYFSSSPTPQE